MRPYPEGLSICTFPGDMSSHKDMKDTINANDDIIIAAANLFLSDMDIPL
jgi:hypothetical protein